MKLSLPRPSIPRPTFWDMVAILIVVIGAILAGSSWAAATSGGPIGSLATTTAILFATAQVGVAIASLFALGKTAKNGTITGNLAAVTGTLLGVSGGLLAAALWAAA